MNKITLIATSTFGLEAIVRRELEGLGFKVLKVSDGRIEFDAALEDIPKVNLWLRTADRVLLKVGEFEADNFDKLFNETSILSWGNWISKDGKIDVHVRCVKSTLESERVCQSMVKKAVVEKLKAKYKVEWLDETGAEFSIHVSILKDVVTIAIDTTGNALHKRGYRMDTGEVPLRENLAAALVFLSFWKKDRLLIDPMCGAGTILIEAAMIGKNIAPGLNREFVSEKWSLIDKKYWKDARQSAKDAINKECKLEIFGYDLEAERIKDSIANAKKAGVGNDIVFEQKDIKDLVIEKDSGIMISNPPYGIKLSADKELVEIYNIINNIFKNKTGWSLYVLTADKNFTKYFKRSNPDRVRKLYNGTIEVGYYQYYGQKPKK